MEISLNFQKLNFNRSNVRKEIEKQILMCVCVCAVIRLAAMFAYSFLPLMYKYIDTLRNISSCTF